MSLSLPFAENVNTAALHEGQKVPRRMQGNSRSYRKPSCGQKDDAAGNRVGFEPHAQGGAKAAEEEQLFSLPSCCPWLSYCLVNSSKVTPGKKQLSQATYESGFLTTT